MIWHDLQDPFHDHGMVGIARSRRRQPCRDGGSSFCTRMGGGLATEKNQRFHGAGRVASSKQQIREFESTLRDDVGDASLAGTHRESQRRRGIPSSRASNRKSEGRKRGDRLDRRRRIDGIRGEHGQPAGESRAICGVGIAGRQGIPQGEIIGL